LTYDNDFIVFIGIKKKALQAFFQEHRSLIRTYNHTDEVIFVCAFTHPTSSIAFTTNRGGLSLNS